jgi:nucleoside-diphosphate-sugar epimerase
MQLFKLSRSLCGRMARGQTFPTSCCFPFAGGQGGIDPRAQVVYCKSTADDQHRRKLDVTKAKTLIGWEPKIALREGLPLMVDDFKERQSVQ